MNTPAIRHVLLFSCIGLIYFLAGKYGYLLEIQPNPVYDLRPTAGIALAVLLVFGIRRWPALLMGAFLVHLFLYLEYPHFALPTHATALSVCLAMGDTVQAVIGAYLIQRLIGSNLELSANRDIITFLLVGGPVCCVIGAFWTIASLSTFGLLAEENWWLNWLGWWSGNVISVAIITPLMLCIFSAPKYYWSKRRKSLTLSLSCALIAIAASNSYVRFQDQMRLKLDFDHQAMGTANSVETALVRYLDVLHSLGSLYSSSEYVSREKFRQFTAPALDQLDGIQALSWNPVVKKDQRATVVAQTRAEGFKEFQITQRNNTGLLHPADERSEHVVVHYIEPYSNNESALGFDVASNPVRQRTLAAARDSGKLLATSRINLVQELGAQSGILAFLPVYATGKVPDTLFERRSALRGYLVGVFRLGDVLASTLRDTAPRNTLVRLYDSSQTGPAVPLAAFGINNKGQGELVDGATQSIQNPALSWSSTTEVAGRHWRIEIQPGTDSPSKQHSTIAGFLTLAGPLIAGLISAFLLLVTGRNANLAVSNESLEREISERKHTEIKLFKEKKKAEITLNSIGDAVITTDANHIISSLNPIAEELTGWSSRAAHGLSLRHVYQTTSCNTPASGDLHSEKEFFDLLATGITSNALLTHRNGKVYSIFETQTPIQDNAEQVYGTVVVFRDVTEQDRLTNQISYQASHDALTGLINRHEFERRLQGSLHNALTQGFNHTLCYLDLDAFKTVNDTGGHRAGDELLRQITALFKTHIRQGDTLGRLGGDEFGLLLEHCTLSNAEHLCDELRKSVENYCFQWEGWDFRIGVSIGLAPINRNSSNIAELLTFADNACYAAKNSGKNQVHSSRETELAPRQQTESI